MFSNLLFAVILIHILAGLISLSAGATALAAPKGGRLHRRAGRVFVAVMLVMTGIATVVATFWSPVRINVVAGLVTFYLVLTAVLTVRRPAAHASAIDVGAMLVAVAAGILGIVFGIEARGTPRGVLDGIPYAAYFVFGAVALLASALDLRMIVAGGVHGK